MKVRIERQALAMIIASSIEHFAKETVGMLYGIRGSNSFMINHTYPHSNAYRTEYSVLYERNGRNRVNGYFGRFLDVDLIGGFHSHTYFSQQNMSLVISKEDKKEMCKKPSNIELILCIKEFEKNKAKEFVKNTIGGYVIGQNSKYKFNAGVFYTDVTNKGEKKIYHTKRAQLKLI